MNVSIPFSLLIVVPTLNSFAILPKLINSLGLRLGLDGGCFLSMALPALVIVIGWSNVAMTILDLPG